MKFIYTISYLFLALTAFAQQPANTKYYRHLRYNHVSPHIPIVGVYEISGQEAAKTSHYIFKFDEQARLVEVINHHYHHAKIHPLTNLGAYRTSISYSDHTETRVYFDKNDQRITNQRDVYKEVYHYGKKNFIQALHFYDVQDQPMESSWKIARYQWKKKKKLVIEERFNLANEAVNISPYFEFGITGIQYNKQGLPTACFNLDEKLKPVNNSVGVAAYKDMYNEQGSHIQYSYHDQDDQLVKNQWGFAFAKKGYDDHGNQITLSRFDENKASILEFNVPSNIHIKIAEPASQQDSMAIREKSLGYLIALQELKPELMKNVFHEQLAKRTVGYDRKAKQENVKETTYEQMIAFAESWNKAGNKFPPKPTNQVIILDIYNRIATVKLVSDNWVEYLHLIKTNKEWKIINLLWQHKDSSRYK